jgi:2',3'-cyclic-nucleotide 2'-phosphodiesterase (5'-nucleotidase family)
MALGALGLALLPFPIGPFAVGNPLAAPSDARLIILSDLHSAYESAAATLGAVAAEVRAAAGRPIAIAINGDIFERGNVVALRSDGVLDWRFLEALRSLAPVVVNLGNHETALLDDLAEVVRRLRAIGITVVSNIGDARTGLGFAEPVVDLAAGGRILRIAALGTDELMTYRQPVRPTLVLPEPAAYGRERIAGLLAGADIPVVLSHAGVSADRAFLDRLPPGTLIVGGHEHLTFLHGQADGTRYVHVGSWNRGFAVADISSHGGRRLIDVTRRAIAPDTTLDKGHAAAVREMVQKHLTEQDRVQVGRLAAPLGLGDAARVLAGAMARATQSHIGIMSHTTLGTGLPAGSITAYDLAAFIRFDGPLFLAELDGATVASLYGVANQDGELPLAARRGDFIYMNVEPVSQAFRYRVVTNGWTRLPANQRRYFDREGLTFTEIPEKRLRAIMAEALPD